VEKVRIIQEPLFKLYIGKDRQEVYNLFISENFQKEPELFKNEKGKPYIKNSNIFFNISHSGQYVVLAQSSYEIGVDIQKHKKQNLDVARRFFAKSEYEHLMSVNDKNKEFFRLWTLKESYMKALGKGFSLPMCDFEIKFENDKPFIEGCKFFEYTFIEDFSLAVCVKNL